MRKNFYKKEVYYWGKVLLDGIFLLSAFFLVYYIRRGHIRIEDNFIKFLPLLVISWFLTTIFSKKFKTNQVWNFYTQVKPYFFSALGIVALLSLEMYVLGWYHLSRFIVFFPLGVFLIFEIIFLSLRELFKDNKKEKLKLPFSMIFFYLEILFILIIFCLIYYYHKKNVDFMEGYPILFLGISFIWFLISLLIHKYEIKLENKILNALYPFWKSEVFIIFSVSFFLFAANLVNFPRNIVLGSLLLFSILENIIVTTYFLIKKNQHQNEDVRKFHFVRTVLEPETAKESGLSFSKGKYFIPGQKKRDGFFGEKLKNVYLSQYNELFEFISKKIDLLTIDIMKSIVFYANELSQIKTIKDDSCAFFLNMSEINHFRYINRAFIHINNKIQSGGIFVGKFESLIQNKNRLFEKHPTPLAYFLYGFRFVFKRVCPKLPGIRRIYFSVTKGKNRVLSKAEILGRLSFCGFRVISFEEINGFYWFIARKTKTPSLDKHPSYGPLFRQKRIGQNGDIVYIYKLRTMYPYSEYIQDYLVKKHQLNEIGKIKDDFRITGWGRLIRKLWIDEIPMIINMIRGEIKLVGVRPLSDGFFKLCPDDLKEKRIQVKMGLFPPYYVDMPEKIEEVWESESIYLDKYSLHPLRTDISYFFRILKNILFYHAKSG